MKAKYSGTICEASIILQILKNVRYGLYRLVHEYAFLLNLILSIYFATTSCMYTNCTFKNSMLISPLLCYA